MARMVASVFSGKPRMASRIRYCCGSSPAARALASPSLTNMRMRCRSSASARYSSGVIAVAIPIFYRNTIYPSTGGARECAPTLAGKGKQGERSVYRNPEGSAQERYVPTRGNSPRELQRLTERFLSLVVFVALALVKLVCAVAKHIRAQVDAGAFMLARPFFRSAEKQLAGSLAAGCGRHDQSVDLGAHGRFQHIIAADVQPSDHFTAGFRDKHRVHGGGLQAAQALPDFFRRCGISQFAGKFRKPRGIARSRPANLGFCCVIHFFFLRRACTAALFSSRKASAAIQRAAREFCVRMLSAVSMAARFSAKFRLPILRNAQFTAFRTKFRSSPASCSITLSERTKRASGASLSL